MGFPGGLDRKESAYSSGALGSIAVLGKFPGERHGNPLQYSCLENPHGQRAWWLQYTLWGPKESYTNEATRHMHIEIT